jgi:hypothetical protein
MTNQHPLTDEIIEEIAEIAEDVSCYDYPIPIFRCDMRAAADWQLEQVIEWLNETISERGSNLEAVNIPEELREAMRPTNTQESNQ